MKSKVKYILIFFTICFILGKLSTYIIGQVYSKGATRTLNEISTRLENKETIHLESSMLEAYLLYNRKDISYKGTSVNTNDMLSMISPYKNYELMKNNDNISINISETSNATILKTLKGINAITIFIRVTMNIVVIIIGIYIYKAYNASRRATDFKCHAI